MYIWCVWVDYVRMHTHKASVGHHKVCVVCMCAGLMHDRSDKLPFRWTRLQEITTRLARA